MQHEMRPASSLHMLSRLIDHMVTRLYKYKMCAVKMHADFILHAGVDREYSIAGSRSCEEK